MRLTTFLFGKTITLSKKPHGFKFRGKNRVVRDIKTQELRMLRKDYERTELNMLYLRHPYLTVEQSKDHMSHVDGRVKFWDDIMKGRCEKYAAKSVTLPEILSHLKVKEAWD